MKRTFLMTGLAVLTLAFFMTGCNSMKKLQKEVIETAVWAMLIRNNWNL